MVLVLISEIKSARVLLKSASVLALQLQKSFVVIGFVGSNEMMAALEYDFKEMIAELGLSDAQIVLRNSEIHSISSICEELEASFLVMQVQNGHISSVRRYLNACRDLRIPYLFFKNSFSEMNLDRVILPVGFLEEELEKAQFAAAFGRFCGSEIRMLVANDAGTKAARNAEKMQHLFDKFDFRYTIRKAAKDSFKLEFESAAVAEQEDAGIVIISASRDYGLDDLIFGPKEYSVIKKSRIPVLLVNPRGDLYALCD